MDWRIRAVEKLQGIVFPPGDKSITHRAIMFASLAEGASLIEDYLGADDCLRTLAAFQAMGVRVERTPVRLRIQGAGLHGLKRPAAPIDAGNSGTTTRLLCGVLAGQNFSAQIAGDESLSRRPMKRIIEPLANMGVKITARDGNFLPLEVQGNPLLQPISFSSPVASAQVKSCIILAALQATGTTHFHEPIRSRDHTERMLAAQGASIAVTGSDLAITGPAHLKPISIRIPGDISSAAFFMVGAAMIPGSKVTFYNVGVNPTRDGILDVLRAMGAAITVRKTYEASGEPVADFVIEGAPLQGTAIEAPMIPRLIDEIPILALAATQARGRTVISGAGELRVKESDRLKTIALELGKMGARIQEKTDGLVIEGGTRLRPADVESHGDHRLAMTLAVAGLVAAGGETVVHDTACVQTSFPGFSLELQKLFA
jgi:3-phosphoshikimate 1-carboxyvinyltransferase